MDWQPGDRVEVNLPVLISKGHRYHWVGGTVRVVDEPGLPSGVRVDLDYPVNGAQDCYTTHDELRARQRALGCEREARMPEIADPDREARMDEEIPEREGIVLCDERAHSCRCREPKNHKPPHRCHPDCGGAWTGSQEGGDFEVIEWPQGIGPAQLLMGALPLPVPALGYDEEW